jgi:exodeoxyribonuclease-3
MKRISLLIFAFLSAITLSYSQGQSLRVITYNIMDGFSWGKDTVRQAKVAHWLKHRQANVAALQELCGYTQGRLEKEARSWGHHYAVLLKESGY